ALVQVVIIAAAVVAFLPWMSILASVLYKGITAIRPNFVYQDLRTTTPDDELGLGGAAHALLGSLVMVVIATVIKRKNTSSHPSTRANPVKSTMAYDNTPMPPKSARSLLIAADERFHGWRGLTATGAGDARSVIRSSSFS
ncbi:MAG: hypothetical protein ACKOQZ_07515, partial [Actinomycetota bacterium]